MKRKSCLAKILEDDKPCENYGCKKNLFFHKLKWKPTQTELSDSAWNCSPLLTIQGPLIFEDIAKIYGLSRQRIQQIEERAKVHLGKKVLKDDELRNEFVTLGPLKKFLTYAQKIKREDAMQKVNLARYRSRNRRKRNAR